MATKTKLSRTQTPSFLLTRISSFLFTIFTTIFIIAGSSVGKQCDFCGSMAVPYPLSTSAGCGDPNYPVFCNTTSGALYMKTVNESYYPIENIDPRSQTFVVTPASFVGNTCRTTDIVHNGVHLNRSLGFSFSTDNTLFLLNCSWDMLQTPLNCSESSLCMTYLNGAPAAEITTGCRSSKICCTINVGGEVTSYNVHVRNTRCTGYKSYMNLDPNSPLTKWKEGLEVRWNTPAELPCRNQSECVIAISNSTCRNDPANYASMRCYCNANLRWDPAAGTCKVVPCGGSWRCHKRQRIALVAGLASALLLLVALVGFHIYRKRKLAMEERGKLRKERTERLSASGGGRSAKLFTGKEMKRATNNFSDDLLLGSGGFGEVYKGTLDDGTLVAVKIAKVGNTKSTDQVLNEVSILSQVNHRSLVQLLGCCVELDQPLLVYEFIPNGTLHEHIHTDRFGFLHWNRRLKIAQQTAEALAYLHSSVATPIYHRDVKSSNILLDHKCNAKFSDFGTSRFVEDDASHVSTCVQGTIGYLDPEYYRTYHLTDRSDVYSFGVVLLELLTSKKVIDFMRGPADSNLAMYVQNRVEEGRTLDTVDAELKLGASKRSLEAMKYFCLLAVRCLEERSQDRPSMKEVVEEIEHIIDIDTSATIFTRRHTLISANISYTEGRR